MKEAKEYGWVVINQNNPNLPDTDIVYDKTFSRIKRDAIHEFTKNNDFNWRYWYSKCNFRCVRATRTINMNIDA